MHVVDIAVDLLHVVHLRHRCRRAVGVLPTLVLLCPRARVARSMITVTRLLPRGVQDAVRMLSMID